MHAERAFYIVTMAYYKKSKNDTDTLSLTLNSTQDILDKIYINYLRGKTKTKEKSWYSRRNLSPFSFPDKCTYLSM